MRARRWLGTAVAALAAVTTVAGAAPASAQAGPGVPPGGHALPHLDPTAIAVDDETGRVAVLSPAGVSIHEDDGSPVDEVDVQGTEIAAHGGMAFVLDPANDRILRFDMGLLRPPITFALPAGEGWSGLAVGGGRVWTSGRSTGTGTYVVGLSVNTGAVTSESPTLGFHPLALAASDGRLVAVEQSGETVTDAHRWTIGGGTFTALADGTLPQSGVTDVAITYDGVGILVGSTSHPTTLREYWVGDLSLRQTYPTGAGTVALAADREQHVLAWTRAGVDGPETTVRSMYEDEAVTLDLAFPATYGDVGDPRDLALAPDGQWVYTAIDGTGPGAFLVARPLAPTIDPVDPPVVGKAGGASVTLTGSGLTGAEVAIDGTWLETQASTATSVTFTVPVRAVGTDELTVQNPLGVWSDPVTLHVVDLGVHPDVAAMVGATATLAGAPQPPPSEVDAVEQAIAGGASAGAWPVALVTGPDFARHRAPLVRLYRAMLERRPDAAGLAFWLDRLEGGGSLAHTASAFAASPEFRERYGSLDDGAFVDRLYENVLDRPADAAGRAHWVQQLRRGATRGKVALWFSESSEHRTRTAAQVGVVLLHLGLLQRPPTASELAEGIGTDPETLALELMGSEEHAALVP